MGMRPVFAYMSRDYSCLVDFWGGRLTHTGSYTSRNLRSLIDIYHAPAAALWAYNSRNLRSLIDIVYVRDVVKGLQ